jgi:hypothetical protein
MVAERDETRIPPECSAMRVIAASEGVCRWPHRVRGESHADVVPRFLRGQGQNAAAQSDALLELTQFWAIQLVKSSGCQTRRICSSFSLSVSKFEGADASGPRTQFWLSSRASGVLAGPAPLVRSCSGDQPLDVGHAGLGLGNSSSMYSRIPSKGSVVSKMKQSAVVSGSSERAQERGLADCRSRR